MLTSVILSRAGEICGGGDFPPPSSSLPNTLAVQGVCLKIRFFPKAFLQGKSSECYYFAAISPVFSNINISVAKKSTGFLIAIALILQFSPGVILSPHPRGWEVSRDILVSTTCSLRAEECYWLLVGRRQGRH